MEQDLRLQALENEVKEVKNTLDTLVDLVSKMNSGLYDDEDNNHVGLISKYKNMELELKTLKSQVEALSKVNTDKALENTVINKWKEFGKDAAKLIVQMVAMYLIMKGFISPDAVL